MNQFTPEEILDLLDEGPDIGLRYDFTARLTRRIDAATDKRVPLKWYAFSAVLVALAFGLSYLSMAFFDGKAAQQFIAFANHVKWVVGFVVVGFLAVQYVDRRLVV
jgi:hypothetical protein